MTSKLKNKLIGITKAKASRKDSAHDFLHLYRVMELAERVAVSEKADLDIVLPAALFHDIVIYPKNHPRSKNAPKESALLAGKILKNIKEYPQEKISKVQQVIKEC